MRFFKFSSKTQRRLARFRERFLGWLIYPMQLVLALFLQLGQTMADWWSRRNLRFLLQGLPALLLALGAVVFGVVVYFQDRNLLATMYKNQALFSLMQVAQLGEGKDNSAPLAMADTCYQRLGAVSPDEPEYSWGMAMVRLAQMQTVAAEAVMTASAKAGYGPAHLWLGQRRLQTPLAQMTPNVLDDAEQHLLRAAAWKKSTDRSPDVEIGARSLLAEIYFQRGRRDQAIEELIKVAGARPELRFKLALWLSLDDKRRDEARTHARSAAEAFQKRVDASIDDHTARFSLIQCHLLLAEFDLAKNHALRGGTLARNSEAHAKYRDDYARLLYQVLIVEYEFQTFEGKSPAERFALLEGALQLFPNDIALLERLMTFFRQPGEQGDKARKVINDLRDSDRFAPLAYMFLGLDAYRNDNSDEARFYWEQALKRSPSDMPLVANNLAWIVATQEPVDLKRALELIETALRAQNASENPHLRSTRGRILARMGRHEEALTDLQKGLPAWLNNPMYVRQLADHYRQLAETSEKLNHTTAAANYKRLADEWAAKAAQPPAGGPTPNSSVAPSGKPQGKAEPIPPAGSSVPDPKKSTPPAGKGGGQLR